jgi:hypothetical protein
MVVSFDAVLYETLDTTLAPSNGPPGCRGIGTSACRADRPG